MLFNEADYIDCSSSSSSSIGVAPEKLTTTSSKLSDGQ